MAQRLAAVIMCSLLCMGRCVRRLERWEDAIITETAQTAPEHIAVITSQPMGMRTEQGGSRGTVVVRWTAGQQVDLLISCIWGMIHNKIHLSNPVAKYTHTLQNCGL